MSDNVQAPPRHAAAEPSLAELFDPAALEARLAEARERRAAALAERAAAADRRAEKTTGEAPVKARGARIRTLDMGAASAPGGPASARADATRQAPAPRTAPVLAAPSAIPSPVPASVPAPVPVPIPARKPPAAGAVAWPFDRPERPGKTPMAERLAAVVSLSHAPAPAPTPHPVARQLQPLAILGIGLLVGGLVTGGTLVLLRSQPPDVGSPPQATTARIEEPAPPAPRVENPDGAVGSATLGSPRPPAADVARLSLADAPTLPGDAALPRSVLPVLPDPAPVRPASLSAPAELTAVAALPAVEAPPPLAPSLAPPALPGDAEVRPPGAAAASASIGAPVDPLRAPAPSLPVLPARAPVRPASLPAPAEGTAVAALPAVEAPPPLAPPPDPPALPGDAEVRPPRAAAASASIGAPVEAPRAPAPSLPAVGTPRSFAGVAAELPPPAVPDRAAPHLRFASDPPAAAVRAALTLPSVAPATPRLGYALVEPTDESAAPRQSAGRTVRPAAPSAARAGARVAATARPAPTRVRTTPTSSASRAQLERAVEDMLRDRLLRN